MLAVSDLKKTFLTPEGTRGLVYQGDESTGLDGLPDTAVRLFADQFLIRAETRGNGRCRCIRMRTSRRSGRARSRAAPPAPVGAGASPIRWRRSTRVRAFP